MDWKPLLTPAVVAAIVAPLANVLVESLKAWWNRRLQEQQAAVSVGVMSHMAQVAFDNHVKFCEQYMEQFFQAIDQEGRPNGSPGVEGLEQTRRECAVWLTSALDDSLRKIERAVASGLWLEPSGSVVSTDAYLGDMKEVLREFLGTEKLAKLRDGLMGSSSNARQ